MDGYVVAVVGATGLVGRKMVEILEERAFPVHALRLLASPRSAGTTIDFRGNKVGVEAIGPESFAHVDVALFSAGGDVSREWGPAAVRSGTVVIDNSSAWRMTPEVPLLVPEVNPEALTSARAQIIANPNCSTIQMVVALKPLQDRYGLRRIIVSTYQSVGGAGKKGLQQLEAERRGDASSRRVFAHAIDNNALPHIAEFTEDGFTVEEHKMIGETRKILGDSTLPVSPTCVRIPVTDSHSESVYVELGAEFELEEVRGLLAGFPGIALQDDPSADLYPLAASAAGHDDVFVGRLRRDPTMSRGLMMWIVSDNLRKGAATNAVQIAELWRALKEAGK